ncbi:M48 family metallopeptidase [Acinetobacter sp. Marseille-Q1618]|uniref:M48 family metallopeptidase n=1 Tax=Acinetobacter sp. Marseille-Q1618 TaxID=2697502 RepID=UPI00156EFC2F|nr:M48 family metallopeptidase [Acinetobacter sp. Marseille-Q1618]
MRTKNLPLALAFSTTFLTGCMTTTNMGLSGIDRKQFMLIPSQEYFIEANKGYNAMMIQYKQQGVLDRKPEITKRVVNIAKKITAQVEEIKPKTAQWTWEMHVINTTTINAFCTGEGKMAVFEGMISTLKLTDDELAAIIGHEISHALLEHGRERASRDLVTNLAVGQIGGNAQILAYFGTKLGLSLPHSRKQESEADLLGLQIAAKAGYNPNAAITLWKKFGELNKGSNNKLSELLSTHPIPDERMKALELAAPKFMPYYLASKYN